MGIYPFVINTQTVKPIVWLAGA